MRASTWALALTFSTVTGCAGLLGFDELVERTTDAGTSTEGGGRPMIPPVASFHVSAAGDDTADGSTARPLRTLTEAVRRADEVLRAAADAGGGSDTPRQTIAMCEGDYPQSSLAIRGPITVRGNYNCVDWQPRQVPTTGAGISDASSTRIFDEQASEYLLAAESNAQGSPELESLSIGGSRVATVLALGSGVRLRYVDARNSSVPEGGTADATFAVYIDGVDVDIEHCNISIRQAWPDPSAIALKSSYSAVGIVVNGGPHRIARSFINVDPIEGACQGVTVSNEGELELFENRIFLQGCDRRSALSDGAVAVAVRSSVLRSTRNAIQFEAAGSTIAGIPVIVGGIVAVGTGSVSSDGDRILSPARLRRQFVDPRVQFLGIFVDGPRLERVTNASIYLRRGEADFELFGSAAIRINKPSVSLLAHNTIFVDSDDPAPPVPRDAGADADADADAAPEAPETPGRAFYFDDPVAEGSLTLDRNLVLAGNGLMRAIRGRCTPSRYSSVEHNRYEGFDVRVAGPGCSADAGWNELSPDASANTELQCDGGCGQWLNLDPESLMQNGFRVMGDCEQLRVPSSPTVTLDGTGATRPPGQTTTVGATLSCP